MGAGEVLVTSVDKDGTNQGPDKELIEAVTSATSLPIIASGGHSNSNHIAESLNAGSDAVAMASAVHYEKATFQDMKDELYEAGFRLPHRILPSKSKDI
jgi:cyclase